MKLGLAPGHARYCIKLRYTVGCALKLGLYYGVRLLQPPALNRGLGCDTFLLSSTIFMYKTYFKVVNRPKFIG